MDHEIAGGGRYSRVAIAIHWLTAAAILFELALGLTMTGPPSAGTFAGYQLHKSIGIVILVLTVIRIAWRLGHPPPELQGDLKPIERQVARATHTLFYVLLLAIPLTGWLVVSTSKVPVPTHIFSLLPFPHIPGVSALDAATKGWLHELAESSHYFLALGAIALLLLHVAGALKHHFADRNGYLARILPSAFARSQAALGAIAGGLAVFLIAGALFTSLAGETSVAKPDAAQAPAADSSATSNVSEQAAQLHANSEAQSIDAASPEASASALPESKSADWTVDHRESSLGFSVDWDGQRLTGRFSNWTARIHFDPDALDQSSVDVSVTLASASTGRSEVDEALPGSDWFSAATQPTARFIARTFRKTGNGRFEAAGNLTIRGKSQPVTLPFQLAITGDSARMTGSTTIDRLSFGIGEGEWSSTDSIAANVSINATVVATRKSQ